MKLRSLTHTSGVGPPEDGHSLPLAGSAVGDEGLTVAVFMDRTLTHVRHTRPTESRRTEDKIYQTVSSILAVPRFLEVIFLCTDFSLEVRLGVEKHNLCSCSLTCKMGRNRPHGGPSETPTTLTSGTPGGRGT